MILIFLPLVHLLLQRRRLVRLGVERHRKLEQQRRRQLVPPDRRGRRPEFDGLRATLKGRLCSINQEISKINHSVPKPLN